MNNGQERGDDSNQPETNAFASLEAMLQMEQPSTATTQQAETQKEPVSDDHPSVPSSRSKAHVPASRRSYHGDALIQRNPQKRTKAATSAKENKREREPSEIAPVRKKKNRKQVVSTKESIVGFRPTHWARDTSKPSSGRKMFAQPNRKKRQADLEAGLNRAMSSTPPPSNAESGARTFLPTFLSNACPQEDEIEDTTEELGTTTAGFSPTRSSDTPAPPYKTPKKSKKGPLGKRMQALRDAAKGEQIRLHSGQYPFSRRSSDRSDPRNRATSTSSVTVLGSPVSLNRQLVSALCYLHEWTTTETTNNGSSCPPVQTLVWVIFRSGTTTDIKTGGQLRLYNAIAVPTQGSSCDKWVIFHTSICEPYPSELPALEDVAAAVATAT